MNALQTLQDQRPAQHLALVHALHQYDQPLLLEPGFPYGEDLLQFIWGSRLFDHHALRTVDGRPVEVLRPGRIQKNSGPDLADAQIRIDGQMWAGTVEVHLRSSDWNAHGHQFDPAYENVILHVVYEHDQEIRTAQGRALPTIELLPRISTDSIRLHHSLMTAQGFVPCAGQIQRVDPFKAGAWLERVLVERLERKTMDVLQLYHRSQQDASATFYHMFLQGLGMKVNAEPFGMLANALPLRILKKYRDDVLRTEALLFGQAGLLMIDMVDDHPRMLQQEYRLLAHMHQLRPAPMAAWKFGRMRPGNFPTIRIAQFASIFTRCEGDLNLLLEQDRVKEIHRLLDVEAPSYWLDHYRFDKPSTAKAKHLGSAAADHLVINAIVPVLFAMGKVQGRPALKERALGLLEQMPAECNTILTAWAGLGIEADSAARGQALIEQKNMYCNGRRCLTCGFGNELLKRTQVPGI